MWPYRNVNRKDFENRKAFVASTLQSLGGIQLNLAYNEGTTTIGEGFEETWIAEKVVYQYKGSYYHVSEILFPKKPFIVIEFADSLNEAMEDAEPFPYDLNNLDIIKEVKYSLGVEPYPVIDS